MREIKTIGYEGTDVQSLIRVLRAEAVDVLVDVRAVAISRRKGFSKAALSAALADDGIGYVHLRELGDPKAGREAARAGHISTFRRIYAKHLRTPGARAELAALAQTVKDQTACLLCFEADYRNCHRSLIVDAIGDLLPVEVDHLSVGYEGAGKVQRTGGYIGQGGAAA